MGIRPNKTNFGLSFRHFWGQKREEEKEKKGMETTFVWILVLDAMMILYGILWDLYG